MWLFIFLVPVCQEGSWEGNTHDGQKDAADQGGGQGGVDGIVNHRIFLAAKTMSNGNTGTHRKADEKVHQQIGDGTGGTHGSYADTAAEPSHNDQIRRIEQKLQKAGEDDGDGIKNDTGQ